MITKITVDFPRIRSYVATKNPGEYGQKDFFEGHKDVELLSETYHRAAMLMLYCSQFPDDPIIRTIGATFGEDAVKNLYIHNYTRRKRVLRTNFLSMHEERENPIFSPITK